MKTTSEKYFNISVKMTDRQYEHCRVNVSGEFNGSNELHRLTPAQAEWYMEKIRDFHELLMAQLQAAELAHKEIPSDATRISEAVEHGTDS